MNGTNSALKLSNLLASLLGPTAYDEPKIDPPGYLPPNPKSFSPQCQSIIASPELQRLLKDVEARVVGQGGIWKHCQVMEGTRHLKAALDCAQRAGYPSDIQAHIEKAQSYFSGAGQPLSQESIDSIYQTAFDALMGKTTQLSIRADHSLTIDHMMLCLRLVGEIAPRLNIAVDAPKHQQLIEATIKAAFERRMLIAQKNAADGWVDQVKRDLDEARYIARMAQNPVAINEEKFAEILNIAKENEPSLEELRMRAISAIQNLETGDQ